MYRSVTTGLAFCLAMGLIACGPKPAPTPPTPPPTTTDADASAPTADAGATTTAPPTGESAAAHKLVILTTACWFGGVWSDGEGDSKDTRKATTEARCHEVLSIAGADDKDHMEQLRALDQTAVDLVGSKIAALAKDDPVDGPRKDSLDKLYKQVAAAQKELTVARRAAAKVKRDLANEPDKLSADEAGAVAPLRATKELEALLNLDAGDLSPEAHAIALLCAMDRLTISRGLPKHLKVYALDGAAKLLFGVPLPDMPTDATKPVKKGLYLTYLTDIAKAAGHPVPDKAKTPKEKEPLAWAGTLEGFSDKLKADQAKLTKETALYEVVEHVARRLESEYNSVRKSFENKGAAPAGSGGATPAKPPPGKK